MKKIFTLIAAAFVAASVNAQSASDVVVFNVGDNPSGTTITKTNTKIVFGAGGFKAAVLKAAKDYLMSTELGQTVEVDGEDKPRYILSEGNSNPTMDGDLPASGAYVALTTNVAGTVLLGVVSNSGKEFHVRKASDATDITALTILNDANDATSIAYDATTKMPEAKITGTVQFTATAGETYYIYTVGSKLGFFGYVFTPTSTAIDAVATEVEAADAPAYNLQGQPVDESYRGVVIQNGKKVVRK